jgi:23S rRNA pseudouridine1911/1915/1917 synthase
MIRLRMSGPEHGYVTHDLLVPGEHHGKRLDRFLQARFPWRSRAWIQRLVREHAVDAQGVPLKPSRAVRAGQRIHLRFEARPEPPAPEVEVPVLLEDDALFIVDKPAGFPVHAKGKQRHRSLIHFLRARHPALGLDLAHRLDRETSGVLLLTKTRQANARLKAQLRDGLVQKEYLALVRGAVGADSFTIDAPLRPAQGSAIRMKMEVHPGGAPALTLVRVVARYPGYTLLAARPRTGRQHQIRAHLAHLGHGIVGDKIYGVPEELFLRFDARGLDEALLAELELPRQALHATAVELAHPLSGAPLRVASPLPADLAGFIARIGAEPCTSAGNADSR